MTERVLGESGSKRRRWLLLLPVLVTAFFAIFWIAGAQAVDNDGFFELGPLNDCTSPPAVSEAGVTNILGCAGTGNNAGPDWADIFDANGNVVNLFGGHAAAFIADQSSGGGSKDSTTFSGFGTSNKNNDPVSTADCAARTPPLTGSACAPWGWASGSVPSKDDLTNVYAYEVINPANNHLILYGGIEREDPSGDSHVDLEFFQDKVALCSTTPCSSFVGIRTVNDVIVVMDLVQGGGIGSVSIRRWNGTEYVEVGLAGGQGCFPSPGGTPDSICAFNNGQNIDGGPWPNVDNHGKVITTLQPNAFTEIGVDLTELIGANPCLSTFMGKTRSSQSFTAELKDFAGPHNFDVCQPATTLSVSPTSTTVHSGDNVTLTFSEANTGNEVLLNPGVVATFNGTAGSGCSPTHPSPGGDTDGDGKLDPGETWTFTCTLTNVTAGGTVSAYAFGTGELSGKLITGQDPCPAGAVCDANERASTTITVINPATFLLKTAQVNITYTFRERNVGNDPLTNVSVTDPGCSAAPAFQSGDTNSNSKLDPGETWVFTCTASIADGVSTSLTNTGTGHGTDSLGAAVPTTNETDSVTVTTSHALPNAFP